MDPSGKNLGVRAKLKVEGNGSMSGGFYDLVEKLPMSDQRVIGLGIHERKYRQVLRGECAYFNWGHGDITLRKEGVDRNANVCLG
jgi:hypothetical protein